MRVRGALEFSWSACSGQRQRSVRVVRSLCSICSC
jgi:hypothetical protein